MKSTLETMMALAAAGLLAGAAVAGGEPEETIKVEVSTGHGGVFMADMSDAAVGDAQTWTTENGKVIDVLRTENGVEIYVDGELMDASFGEEALHGAHVVLHEEMEVECHGTDGEDCRHDVIVMKNGDVSMDGDFDVVIDGDAAEHQVIVKRFEMVCEDEDGAKDCGELAVFSDEERAHLEALGDEGHDVKVIKIRRHLESDDI